MQFQQPLNTSFNPRPKGRLQQISTRDKQTIFGKAACPINLDFDGYFAPWGNQDNGKILNSYFLHKKQKYFVFKSRAHSISLSTSPHADISSSLKNKERYRQRSLKDRNNKFNCHKALKMTPLDMHLDQQTIYSPHKKLGMLDLLGKQQIRQKDKQMPSRVKIFKKTLLKFEKCLSNQQQSDKNREKEMFSTCLTEKFTKDLVADTLTINTLIANRGYRQALNTTRARNIDHARILPRLNHQQRSTKRQKAGINKDNQQKRSLLQNKQYKREFKIAQPGTRIFQEEDNQQKLVVKISKTN